MPCAAWSAALLPGSLLATAARCETAELLTKAAILLRILVGSQRTLRGIRNDRSRAATQDSGSRAEHDVEAVMAKRHLDAADDHPDHGSLSQEATRANVISLPRPEDGVDGSDGRGQADRQDETGEHVAERCSEKPLIQGNQGSGGECGSDQGSHDG